MCLFPILIYVTTLGLSYCFFVVQGGRCTSCMEQNGYAFPAAVTYRSWLPELSTQPSVCVVSQGVYHFFPCALRSIPIMTFG